MSRIRFGSFSIPGGIVVLNRPIFPMKFTDAVILVCFVAWMSLAGHVLAAEANPVTVTNAEEVLRSYQQIQERLNSTQQALERNRQDAENAAARNAEAMTARLQGIEQSLAAQRARDLEAIQSSNRVLLIVAGTFAAMG